MFIVRYQKLFLALTAVLTVAAIGLMIGFGFSFGIDFTGGTLVEVEYQTFPVETMNDRPAAEDIRTALEENGFGNSVVQPTGEAGLIVRTRAIEEGEREALLSVLSMDGARSLTEKRFDSIGATIGQELRTRSLWAIALVIFLIVLYITYAFRKVSAPVQSWKYGAIAVVTLLHDVIVPTGFFVLYGHFTGAEIDVLFVTALLAIIGFSIHDTIVVFDRVRENLLTRSPKETFADTVGKSLSQTFTRSINTSLTVALALIALVIAGSPTTIHFAWLLLVGVIAGTYSSVFFASPLLLVVEGWTAKRSKQ